MSYARGDLGDSDGIAASEVHPWGAERSPESKLLYAGLCSNLAKCLAKRSSPSLGLPYVDTCVTLMKHDIATERASHRALGADDWRRFKAKLADLYTLRGRLHLQMSRFGAAGRDGATVLERIDAGHAGAKQLLRLVERRREAAGRKDRRLAKEVRSWVEEAMHASEEAAPMAEPSTMEVDGAVDVDGAAPLGDAMGDAGDAPAAACAAGGDNAEECVLS